MTKFLQCSDGTWLNLDSVAKAVSTGKSGRIRGAYKFLASNGEVLGESIDLDPTSIAPVLPALPGEALFEFYAVSTERRPKSNDDIVMIEMPILGWRCGQDRATPVTYRPYLDRGASMYLYRLADGRFKDEWGDQPFFETLDAARAHVLRRIQGQWD